MRGPAMTRQRVLTTVLSPRSSSATTRRCISLQEEPYFKAERHISSWATPKLTKQQLVTAVLEWPIEAAGQGAAGLPSEPCQEGWRRQRSPSHLCPLGCVLTTALGPGDPTQTSRAGGGRGGTRLGQGHSSVIDRKQTDDIRQAGQGSHTGGGGDHNPKKFEEMSS